MKKILREDMAHHVLALLLALVLWFFVKSTSAPVRQADTQTRRFSNITIETRNRATDLALVRPLTQTATLTVRAPQDVLERLTVQDLVAYVDLRTLQEGSHELNIRVDLPVGVEVLSASPTRVQLGLEQIISTQVPVLLSLSGVPTPGYYAPPGVVEPATVVVTGGRSLVGSVAPFVVVIDVSNLTDTVTASVPLEPYTTQGQALNVDVNPPQVQYRQPIIPTKRVPLRIVGEGGFAPSVTEVAFEPTPQDIEVAAPVDVLQDLTELVMVVNTSNIRENTIVELIPQVPQGVYLVAPSPVAIRMIVKVEP